MEMRGKLELQKSMSQSGQSYTGAEMTKLTKNQREIIDSQISIMVKQGKQFTEISATVDFMISQFSKINDTAEIIEVVK